MGVGRRLMSALTQALAVQGYEGCALAVVAGNDRAARFYRRLGGREIGRFTDPGPLWRSENIVFAWDELSLLMEAADP
jgi:ribosomal protein S18 acetylase RimI-like enzyme